MRRVKDDYDTFLSFLYCYQLYLDLEDEINKEIFSVDMLICIFENIKQRIGFMSNVIILVFTIYNAAMWQYTTLMSEISCETNKV